VTEESHDRPLDFLEMLGDARKAVLELDWAAWQIPPGDVPLTSRWFADQPPLTNSFLQSYLAFCAWIWRRPISPLEQQRIRDTLLQHWTVVGSAANTSQLYDVVSLVWLFRELEKATAAEQELLRQQCVAHLPDGVFPAIDVAIPRPD